MTNNNSQIVPDFSILWRVLNFSCQISSYILLHNYGMKSFLGPQFPKTFCLLCPESDPISRCFWPHLVLSSRAHKQAEELKGMLFFSCLPEWCHPHSDSAYTKYSAALSIHCHHGYSTASATQPALLPRPTPAATGQRSWLTGSPSNGSGSQWCHGEDETRAKARRARDHLLTHHLREVVVDFSMKGGSLGFERFKVQKKHTIIQRLLQVWNTHPQNGLFRPWVEKFKEDSDDGFNPASFISSWKEGLLRSMKGRKPLRVLVSGPWITQSRTPWI